MKKRSGNIQRRGVNSWRIRYVNNDGIRQAETIHGSRQDAERELAIRLGELAKGLPVSSKPNTVLFEELAADVVDDYKINGYKSIDDVEARYRLHILPRFGKRKAVQITTAMLRKYVEIRQEEGAAVGTINRELEAIRHTFLLARDGRKLYVVPKVPHLREDNVRTGFFTREEVERLTKHLKEPIASLVWFGFLTGWRLEECRGLLWRNVDFVKGEIRLDVGRDKNRAGRVFPMSAELRALLTAMLPTETTPKSRQVVAMNSKGTTAITQRVFPCGAFRKTWKTACHRAGLPCIVEPVKKGGKRGAVKVIRALRTFHDLRRSAARELLTQGYTEAQVMRMCGWKSRSMFDRYNVVTDGDIREKMREIEARHAIASKLS